MIEIGCLECGESSNLLGVYDTAEAASAAHPDAQLRSSMDDGYAGDWRGSGVTVIFSLAEVFGGRDTE